MDKKSQSNHLSELRLRLEAVEERRQRIQNRQDRIDSLAHTIITTASFLLVRIKMRLFWIEHLNNLEPLLENPVPEKSTRFEESKAGCKRRMSE
jgi:hypothetical protein